MMNMTAITEEFKGHPRKRYLCNLPKQDILALIEERGYKKTDEPERIEYGYKITSFKNEQKKKVIDVQEQIREGSYCPVGNIWEVGVRNKTGKYQRAILWGGLESKI